MEDLTGKVAIVTGASSGIGEAIARVLVVVGVHVIGLARTAKDLQRVAKSLKGNKGTFDPFPGDVRIEKDMLAVFAYTDRKYGGIDILVNDAGINYNEYITNSTTDHFRNLLYTDALATPMTSRIAVQYMTKRKRRGDIVNIISSQGLKAIGLPMRTSLYPTAKFTSHAVTEDVRQEMTQKSYPIRIIGIYPQLVNTPMIVKTGQTAILKIEPYIESADVADTVLYALEVPRHIQISRILIGALFALL